MKKTQLPLLFALLLAPALTLANTVAIDWSGQIAGYDSAGSGFPQSPLSDTNVSGVINLNLDLLPTPDPGNPTGVLSFTGTDFLRSSVQWVGGNFQPDASIAESDSLYLDLPGGQCTITDSAIYLDGLGAAHLALVSITVMGLENFTPGQGPSFGGDVSGTGGFADSTADGSQGFFSAVQLDSVRVTTSGPGPEPVPEPDAGSLGLGMLLAIIVARIRVRRQPV
jgi:hypothetical protein